MSSHTTGAPVCSERPGRGVAVGAEADMTDHAGLPADAGLDQQVALIGAIAQHLDVADVRDARDLRGGVLQQALRVSGFADDAREGRECALVDQGFVRIDHRASYAGATIGFDQPT